MARPEFDSFAHIEEYVAELEDEVRELTRLNSKLVAIDKAPSHTSDGYHTFDELYEHRYTLTALAFTALAGLQGDETVVWKSRRHRNNVPEMYDEMFIAGANLSTGQIAYHLPNDYWDLVRCPEIPEAPVYDGYTSDDVLERIKEFLTT
jgi:hypothetical protein